MIQTPVAELGGKQWTVNQPVTADEIKESGLQPGAACYWTTPEGDRVNTAGEFLQKMHEAIATGKFQSPVIDVRMHYEQLKSAQSADIIAEFEKNRDAVPEGPQKEARIKAINDLISQFK